MKVGIIGSGNVATHFVQKLLSKGVNIVGVHSRNFNSGKALAARHNLHFINDIVGLPACDLIFCLVKDSEVEAVSASLTRISNTIVIHTSGTVDLAVLKKHHPYCGVFYPMYSFSKETSVCFEDISLFIEGSSQSVNSQLVQIARDLFDIKNIKELDSKQRKALHLIAVMTCNFTNHLYYLAENIAKENNLDYSLLHPLIKQTAEKAIELSPKVAQTGPAKRNDSEIIKAQIELLKGNSDLQMVYQLLSKSITNTYN
jgi:predicted short-subunit dehydrogenase-like oxidoreductase (DUF2520 family)